MTREEFEKLEVGDKFIFLTEHTVYDTLKDGTIRYEADGKIFCVDYQKCSLPNIDYYKQQAQRWEQSFSARYKEIQGVKIQNLELKKELEKVSNLASEIDWEHRRYSIAKEVLPSFVYKDNEWGVADGVSNAIEYADELIKQLKVENK